MNKIWQVEIYEKIYSTKHGAYLLVFEVAPGSAGTFRDFVIYTVPQPASANAFALLETKR